MVLNADIQEGLFIYFSTLFQGRRREKEREIEIMFHFLDIIEDITAMFDKERTAKISYLDLQNPLTLFLTTG